MKITRYELDYYESILDGEVTQCCDVKKSDDGEWVKFEDHKKFLEEVRCYLVAAADGSMSRNNSENLAEELLESLKDD